MTLRTLLPPLLAAAVLLAGCGGADESAAPGTTASPGTTAAGGGDTIEPATTVPATTDPAATEPPATEPTTTDPAGGASFVRVYFARGEKVGVAGRPIGATEAVGRAALEELLRGPGDADRAAGLTTAIPPGTRLLGVEVADRIGTVDLSGEFDDGGGSLSMTLRLAQVVYTLTQFDTVEAILFRLDGVPVEAFGGEGIVLEQPVGRDRFEDVTPAILLESPVPGETVSSPLRISGTANTYEANMLVRVTGADGGELYSHFVTASSGNGVRGTFDAEFLLAESEPQGITLRVFEQSAESGEDVNVVEIPLRLAAR